MVLITPTKELTKLPIFNTVKKEHLTSVSGSVPRHEHITKVCKQTTSNIESLGGGL